MDCTRVFLLKHYTPDWEEIDGAFSTQEKAVRELDNILADHVTCKIERRDTHAVIEFPNGDVISYEIVELELK